MTRGVWRQAGSGLAALLVGIGLGRFAYTPLIPALIAAAWMSPAAAAYLGATNLAGYLAGAVLGRRLAGFVAPLVVIRAALALSAASFLACAFPLNLPWLFAWRFAVGFTGGTLMVLGPPLILAATPAGMRGRVGGVIYFGVGIGIVLSGTLVPMLAGASVTAAWLGLFAIAALAVAIGWWGWPAGAAANPAHRADGPLLTRPLALLLIAYALDGAGFIPHTLFWVDFIARGLGEGLKAGGAHWVVFGLGAAVGTIVVGRIADRIGLGPSLTLGFVAKAAAVAMPLVLTHPLALALSAFLVGSLVPSLSALMVARLAEVAPAHVQGRLWSWFTVAFAVMQAGGGYVMSLIFSASERYDVLFALAATLLLVSAALAHASRRLAPPATS